MKSPRHPLSALLLCALFLFIPNATTHAGSATWNLNPTSGDWNTAANWVPATVPNGPGDTATFASSDISAVSLSADSTEVAAIVFEPGESTFEITADPASVQTDVKLSISGLGIVNDSGVAQHLTVAPSRSGHSGIIEFMNAASAGEGTVFTVSGSATSGAFGGGLINFHDNSTAGGATVVAIGALAGNEAHGGEVIFDGNATAGNANITVNGAVGKPGFAFGGEVIFADVASANDAFFIINAGTGDDGGGGEVVFTDNATASNGIFTLNGATATHSEGPTITFSDGATADNGFFTLNAGQLPGHDGGYAVFSGFAFTGQIVSAGTATFIMNGGNGAGALAGHMAFFGFTTASQATLIANGGENGGGGGQIYFDQGDGGEARIELFGNGTLDINSFVAPLLTVGSIEGDGIVLLDTVKLSIGSNNLSTTFSGTLQDAGSLEKIGTGTLSLSGANSYTGGTTISAGTLLVKNTTGSATGMGAVQVSGGTLGGKGIISGATTIGTGSGTGASLAPGKGASKPTTLTIQRALTFKADSTYTCRLNTKKTKADQVVAKGVTIESGAQFNFKVIGNKELRVGKSATVISNTSANSISGTFANLPDGSTFTIGANSFQANYEGGNGNDLTLTVVP